jgi:hypothetical protein
LGRRGLRVCVQRNERKRCGQQSSGHAHDPPHRMNRCPLG